MNVRLELLSQGQDRLARAIKQLESIPQDRQVHTDLRALALKAKRVVRNEAPVVHGELRGAVESGLFRERVRKPVAGFVRLNASKAPHWHFREFGTRDVEPERQWFRPAIRSIVGFVADGLETTFRNAVNRNAL